jgi:hypothetical protein
MDSSFKNANNSTIINVDVNQSNVLQQLYQLQQQQNIQGASFQDHVALSDLKGDSVQPGPATDWNTAPSEGDTVQALEGRGMTLQDTLQKDVSTEPSEENQGLQDLLQIYFTQSGLDKKLEKQDEAAQTEKPLPPGQQKKGEKLTGIANAQQHAPAHAAVHQKQA